MGIKGSMVACLDFIAMQHVSRVVCHVLFSVQQIPTTSIKYCHALKVQDLDPTYELLIAELEKIGKLGKVRILDF